ncbi:MAG: TolC family protein [Lentisphaeria bacterium]|nr:TolC family protein [Lentisphaeria bacterium]
MRRKQKLIMALPALLALLAGCASSQTFNSEYRNGAKLNGHGPGGVAPEAFTPGDSLSLNELLKVAEANSAELRSVHASWQAAKNKVPQASSLPDPRLTYGYFVEEVQTKTGPQEQKVAVSQTFPWFGKLSLKEQIAVQSAKAEFQEYQSKRLLLGKEIKSAFHEYAYLREAVELNRQHLELLKGIEGVASIRFKSGKLPQNVLIQVQVEQGKLEDRIKELENLRKPFSSKIYALLSIPADKLLPWPDKSADTPDDIDIKDIARRLKLNNPGLNRLDLLIAKEDYSVKLAKKDYYPDLTVGVEHTDIDGGENPTALMFSINIPIWRDRINASVQEASNRRLSVEEKKRDMEHKLQAQFDLLAYYYSDARRKFSLYANSLIPKARQAIDVAVKGFETGQVGYSDLLDAERTLLEFQLTSARQSANSRIRAAELSALVLNNEPNSKGE